jgi:hypothetical protein
MAASTRWLCKNENRVTRSKQAQIPENRAEIRHEGLENGEFNAEG